MMFLLLAQLSQEAQLSVTAAAMTTMGGALATLFVWLMKAQQAYIEKADKNYEACKEDRKALWVHIEILSTKVGELQEARKHE
jgi:hypothetical protein